VLVQGRLAFYGPGNKFLEYFKAPVPADVYDDLTDNNTVPYSQELKKPLPRIEPLQGTDRRAAEGVRSGHEAGRDRRQEGPSEKGSMLHQFGVLAGGATGSSNSGTGPKHSCSSCRRLSSLARQSDGRRAQSDSNHFYGDVRRAVVWVLQRRCARLWMSRRFTNASARRD